MRCLWQKGTEGKPMMRGLSGPSLTQLWHRTRAPTSAAGGGELADGSRCSSGGKRRGRWKQQRSYGWGNQMGFALLSMLIADKGRRKLAHMGAKAAARAENNGRVRRSEKQWRQRRPRFRQAVRGLILTPGQ
jgi:hypothetical protein